ncbi:MraY family glycosyltransferase [Gillisia hiemivivida]|uniref:Undecaprenyl/decaprenyl-phosphate alpha-N-acetylglucosaminyl 1-phosphate transferase n=1 Tax=Gillisia hiemivivida TaxID=291190 RepID=A0A5C6ZZK4_9FLAO|nr:MraY family glycosyltransferase [Gillisia hiemivivida]TXD95751.1 undecaprenyl/decaprenyl-phosphate alpha-N-acetylglucosaminyl 1-phosphate transferase [Gillisia hiemivivida]
MNLFDQEVILELFRHNYLFFVLALFAGTAGLTYYLIPKVLWVSKEKNLTASVNSRSSHKVETPSFGGVAFFMCIILVLALIQSLRLTHVGNQLIAAITILFMVGLKDDLVVSTARVKFFGQIAATCFIIFSPELHLTNLHGFLGLYEIPESIGIMITGFIVIAIINAYNLIDGIDGLAGIIGIVISGIYAWIFYTTNNPFYVLLSVSVAGTLSAYLRFNFSRCHRKIFMGDSGSLIIGLLLAFLSIKFLVMEPTTSKIFNSFEPASRPLLLLCILFVPIFDTLRVMIIRIFSGESPFTADRNHAHHVLLDLGYSHLKASISLALINVIVIIAYLYFSTILSTLWLSLIVVLLYGCGFLLFAQFKNISRSRARRFYSNSFVESLDQQ